MESLCNLNDSSICYNNYYEFKVSLLDVTTQLLNEYNYHAYEERKLFMSVIDEKKIQDMYDEMSMNHRQHVEKCISVWKEIQHLKFSLSKK